MLNKKKKLSGGGAKWNGYKWYSEPEQTDLICFQYSQLEADVLNILNIKLEGREKGLIRELKYLLEDIEYKGSFNMSIEDSMKLLNSERLLELSQIITQAGQLRLESQSNILDKHIKKKEQGKKSKFCNKKCETHLDFWRKLNNLVAEMISEIERKKGLKRGLKEIIIKTIIENNRLLEDLCLDFSKMSIGGCKIYKKNKKYMKNKKSKKKNKKGKKSKKIKKRDKKM